MTQRRALLIICAVLSIGSCDAPAKSLRTPTAEQPRPTPTLPNPFKLAFAPAYARGVIILPKTPFKPQLLFISDVGDTVPATGPVSFTSRSPDIVTVDSTGTITAQAVGEAWIIASVTAMNQIMRDSLHVLVRCTLELSADFNPPNPILRVGDSFVPQVELWTCQRLVRIEDRIWWRSHHSDGIVQVDSATGRTTALAPGQAFVLAMGSRGNAWAALPVLVLQR